ncbi:nuclear envelope pore membrane protein POM 121-like isoform X3 [Ochotona curzoniae]|uniref:nuclear envelope pore membrane protein POM 121-like isoform X3 n=1 Tax=Ochotona curzoniae TaxID=130825 RepID=UPI001B34BDE5|nr:nuclear envelope pore membrane protein POM 121-like isoform X3 [Ochotona curzoniae]
MSPAAGGERRRPPLASARSGRSGWGWGRVGPAGTALLGLSLLGLALYLVPAAAALAWLAVGATAAWWGWSREPRGPRTAAGPGRHARRPRTLAASPPLKPSVNGDVLEPRTLLEGPDPAELLLLGGYLGKPGPPRDGPARSPLAPAPARRAAPSYPVLSSPVLPPSRRPAHRDSGLLANRFIITPRRRYPIQQPQYSLLGALPTVCWNGCPKKTVLSARNSKMVCSPVTVRIAPPDSKPSRPPPPGWTFNPTVSSPSVSAPDPCAKETVLNALKERRKRTVEEEDPIALDGLENKRRRHDSSGSGHSAFEPLVANGVPAAFVPKPGSLKRGLNVQNADDHSSKRSRTSSVSSLASTCAGGVPSSSRNAISSSYSSTRGFPQPPPPQLGYSVTAEDFDMEKKASLQWFNKALEDKTDTTSDTAAENPPTTQAPLTFSLPAVSTSASPASLTTGPSTNPLLESLKKMQGTPGPPAATEPAAAATALTPSPPKVPSLLAPATCAQPEPLADTSSDSKPAAPLLMLSPASATTPVADATKSPSVAPQAEPPAKAPSPTPSTLLGMLGSSPAQPASPEAPARDAPSSMFKPIFSAAPKSESESPVVTATAPASTAAPTATSSASSPTLKPIFSSMGLSAPTPLASPFFKQTTTAATTPASTAPLFSGLAAATSTVASATVVSSSADSAKPVFGFGLSAVTSAPSSMASSTTTASTTTAQPFPFLFGAPPASGASLTPSGGSTFQFGKPAVPTSTAVTTTFGQSLASTAPTATSSTAGFSGFGSLTTSASAAPSQPTLTFSTTSQAFNIPFGSAAKPSLPSFPGTNPQPAFGATDGQQQQGAAKPTLAPSFGSSFSFGTPTPAPTPSTAPGLAPAQPAFGSTVQSSFGGLKNTATAFGTPASTQPAFGSSSTVFSFGASTTTGFGVSTPTTSSGTSSTVFGSTTPSLFTFGSPSAPAAGSGFGLSVGTPGASSTSGGFSFGAGQSGTTGTATPFGGALSQNSLGTPNQTTPFAFNMASTPESKPVFGGTSTPTFGQNASTPGAVTAGSSLSFGVSSTPTQGFVGMGPFGSAAPSFSIGAGSKTPGARQRLQARRQHTRKK